VIALGIKDTNNIKKIPQKAYSWVFKGTDGSEFLMEIRITKIA